ncbi:hypothetical protein Tsubulata_031873 [Turnera subulata]|uniref:CCHC-type domain-containing protein n=1 Tax=Turnera subulata TaxID=218843 RepID=A0A9Q0G5V7_9ROSI|nr:hypothetical protein Tsubulata_031873 [Turnera subulata]
MLCNRLQRLWGLRGAFRVIDLDHNYYLVRLADNHDYLRVVTGGPWVILDHYLTVEPWQPNFELSSHKVTSVVAWVRVPGLSTELYQREILREVCNRIGRMIRVDYSTQKTERGKFAKVAVELDLSKPLETEACVDGVWYPILYESLPQVCFGCGRAGHLMVNCRTTTPGSSPSPMASQQPAKPVLTTMAYASSRPISVPNPQGAIASQNPKYGEWILVPPRGKEVEEGDSIPAPVKQKTGSAIGMGYQGSMGASTSNTKLMGSDGNSVGKNKSSEPKKGVFITDYLTQMEDNEGLSVKRSRGPAGYTLTGDLLGQSAMDKSKRQVRSKKVLPKENGQGKTMDNIWAGVLAKEVPVPMSFMLMTIAQESPPVVPSPPPLKETMPTVEAAPASPMQVAFDERGQAHSDFSLITGVPPSLAVPNPGRTGGGSTAALAELENVDMQDDQGAGRERFRRAFRDLVFTHRPQLVILLETKVLFSAAFDIIRGCGFDRAEVEEVQGRSGGIWICWRQASVVVSVEQRHVQFLHVKVKFGNALSWFLTAVYASPTPSIRQEFWAATRAIASSILGPWFLIGDFNTYIDQTKKQGGLPVSLTMCHRFTSWIDDCQLMDIGFQGSKFTWEKQVGVARELVMEHLDRGLANQQW